jgi:murein endopeptidase
MKYWGFLFVPALLLGGCGAAVPTAATPATPPPIAATGPSAASPPAPTVAPPSAAPIPADDSATGSDGEEGELDDDMASSEGDGLVHEHPLDGWSQEKIDQALAQDPASLGPISLGYPNGGALFNGIQMPNGDGWELQDPAHAWGTRETIDDLTACIEKVRATFPGTGPLAIGHLSGRRGGRLSPHVSHQSGRDADVGYYYLDGSPWYTFARASNLDRPRTWALVRALVTETDVEYVFMDRSVQRLLKDYAISLGEDRAWLDEIFEGGTRPVIHHVKGHGTHLHVRFYSPVARETGRRVYATMLRRHMVDPPTYFVTHTAKPGETLSHLAKRYGTTTKALQDTNGLKTTLIKAGRDYKVMRRGGLHEPPGPIRIPPRHLPPDRALGVVPAPPQPPPPAS